MIALLLPILGLATASSTPTLDSWQPGAGRVVFDAAVLAEIRADRRICERELDETRRAVAQRRGRIDCPACRAEIQPVQDRWQSIVRREAHLIGADAPRIPDLKRFFQALKIRTEREGIPDGRAVQTRLDRLVASGALTAADRARLDQVLMERRRTITNPADLGRRQIAESIAQTLRWFGVDARE